MIKYTDLCNFHPLLATGSATIFCTIPSRISSHMIAQTSNVLERRQVTTLNPSHVSCSRIDRDNTVLSEVPSLCDFLLWSLCTTCQWDLPPGAIVGQTTQGCSGEVLRGYIVLDQDMFALQFNLLFHAKPS